jgi:flagellar basal body-associated protein FliL
MKSKLKFVIPLVVLLAAGGGGAYYFLLAPKPARAAPLKVQGSLLTLNPEFTVNLQGGHYGRVSVALLLSGGAPAAPASGGSPTLAENDVVRAAITNDLTGVPETDLIDRADRAKLLSQILKDLLAQTDVKVTKVLFTDVVVQ